MVPRNTTHTIAGGLTVVSITENVVKASIGGYTLFGLIVGSDFYSTVCLFCSRNPFRTTSTFWGGILIMVSVQH